MALHPFCRWAGPPLLCLACRLPPTGTRHPVSRSVPAGVNKIYCLTQFNSASLNRHLSSAYNANVGGYNSRGFVEVLAASQTTTTKEWFQVRPGGWGGRGGRGLSRHACHGRGGLYRMGALQPRGAQAGAAAGWARRDCATEACAGDCCGRGHPPTRALFHPLPARPQGTADAVRQYIWLFDEACRDGVEDFLILSGARRGAAGRSMVGAAGGGGGALCAVGGPVGAVCVCGREARPECNLARRRQLGFTQLTHPPPTHPHPPPGDHLYRMDYREFVAAHRAAGADITVAALPCAEEQAQAFGLMKIDDKGRCVRGPLLL